MAFTLQDFIVRVEAEAGDGLPLSRLQAASSVARELEEIGDAGLGYFVDQARHAGHSWSEIGDALGVSKQAAQQKQSVRVALGPNAPTFERLTPRARHVVEATEEVARSLGHQEIGTSHLLLALYKEPDGIGAQILVEAGLTLKKAEAAVTRRAERGPGSPEGRLGYTPRAVSTFTAAIASAVQLGHNYVGTEHLLLGLSSGDGVAAAVLQEHGLTDKMLLPKIQEKLKR